MRRHRKESKRLEIIKYTRFLILNIILIFLLAVLVPAVGKSLIQQNENPIEVWAKDETASAGKSKISQPEIVYPKPEYEFKREEVTIEIPGLQREYKLAWVSDLHMVTDKAASYDVMTESMEKVGSRYDSFQTENGVHAEDLWPEIIKFINYEKFDGVILGGDIMDYCSASNMDVFMNAYQNINKSIPVLYIRADHDYGFWYGGNVFTEEDAHNAQKKIDGDRLEDKHLDFGEFLVVGINGSTKNMTDNQYTIVNNLMEQKKPVIIATHVPYASKVDSSLEALSMQARNKIYYWGAGDYIPYEPTTNYLNKIYAKDTVACQVLAGHLHAAWDGMITEQLPQHIFSPAYQGVVGVIHIKPTK